MNMNRISLMGLLLAGCTVHTTTQPYNTAAQPQPAPQPAPQTQSAPTQTQAASTTPVLAAPATTPAQPTQVAPAQPAFEEPPPVNDAPADVKWSFADGRPKGLRSGAPVSFWIWQDKNGSEWHVRTTTAGTNHRFQGRVNGKTPLKDVQMIRMEQKDRLTVTKKQDVVFDFATRGEEDGFDFKVAGNQCVTFTLRLDGQPAPRSAVQIGSLNTQPVSHHFKLCP